MGGADRILEAPFEDGRRSTVAASENAPDIAQFGRP